MRQSRRPIIIASRRSLLARVQAEAVGRALQEKHPQTKIEYRWIESEGDQLPDRSLADAGGKGLFARAVERALVNGEADLAVHSLKDLPANEATPGLMIVAIPRRCDARDCLITRHGKSINDLPEGATLGTASPRRAAQAKRLRPDLKIELIRGNIETRLKRVLDEERYDATLLAMAGLQRAGFEEHARYPVDPSVMLPAAGQGALAIQCRGDDHVTISRCLFLNDATTAAAVHAERRVVAALDGDCHSPIAVFVEPVAGEAEAVSRMRARVLSPDGQTCLEFDRQAKVGRLDALVTQAIAILREGGSSRLLGGG